MKREMTVDFSEIFAHAEKFGVSWNQANDIFFNDILRYKGFNRIYLGDILSNLADKDEYYQKHKKAYEILADFMKENKLKEMLVLND